MNVIVILLCLAAGPATVPANERPAEVKSPKVQVWEGYYNAKVHTRYHQAEAARYAFWDRVCRGFIMVLAVIALIGPLVPNKVAWWRKVWIIAGAFAFLVSMTEMFYPFGEWSAAHKASASNWNQSATDWYNLYEDHTKLDPERLLMDIRKLRDAVASIESSEPIGMDKAEMERAEKAEMHYQGFDEQAKL